MYTGVPENKKAQRQFAFGLQRCDNGLWNALFHPGTNKDEQQTITSKPG